MFLSCPPDLVITDIIMPDKEGIEIILELKKVAPDVKIIAVSGGSKHMPQSFLLRMAKHLGAKYTFSKPISRQELLAAVQELLGEE